MVRDEPSRREGLREPDAGGDEREGEDGKWVSTSHSTAFGGGGRGLCLWHSSLHSNISNWLWWKPEEGLVQLAQPGQIPGEELGNIHPWISTLENILLRLSALGGIAVSFSIEGQKAGETVPQAINLTFVIFQVRPVKPSNGYMLWILACQNLKNAFWDQKAVIYRLGFRNFPILLAILSVAEM